MSKCELDRLENATKRSPNLKKNEIYKGQKGGICKAFRGHVKWKVLWSVKRIDWL